MPLILSQTGYEATLASYYNMAEKEYRKPECRPYYNYCKYRMESHYRKPDRIVTEMCCEALDEYGYYYSLIGDELFSIKLPTDKRRHIIISIYAKMYVGLVAIYAYDSIKSFSNDNNDSIVGEEGASLDNLKQVFIEVVHDCERYFTQCQANTK